MRKISIILVAVVTCLLTACRSTKHVVQEAEAMHDTLYQTAIQLDTVYKTLYKLDSIFMHDSVFQKEYIKGDTLVQYKYVEKVQYKDRVKTDTLYKSKVQHDTTYVAKTDTVVKTDTKEVVKTPLINGLRWLLLGLIIGATGMGLFTIKTKS